jgi:hypothetical protein
MSSAATLFVDPITFSEMLVREGLDPNSNFHEEETHWGLWLPTVDLPTVGDAAVYPAKIVNKGDAVRVIINNYDLGAIEPRALPEAVQALKAYGGKEAPAYLYSSVAAKIDSVYVFKPKK